MLLIKRKPTTVKAIKNEGTESSINRICEFLRKDGHLVSRENKTVYIHLCSETVSIHSGEYFYIDEMQSICVATEAQMSNLFDMENNDNGIKGAFPPPVSPNDITVRS